jgi:protein O-mannosyl-transferase
MPNALKTNPRRSPPQKSQQKPKALRGKPASSRAAEISQKGFANARLNVALCLLLAGLTLAIYSPVGRHPFTNYDDQLYVTDNPHVKAGLTWDTLTWALTSTEASNWHPLTWLSHAADWQIYGGNPSGHHWTSLLIHAVNVILLFLLLQHVTGATWKSLFVAALFALHPMNVESVAWIAERKNVLSTTFFLLALGAYGWYARKPGVRRYVVLAILFVLGLAAKPMVITLPFVLLLLDFWPLQRVENWTGPSAAFPVRQERLSRLIVEKLPLLVLSAGSAVITVIAQSISVVATQALPLSVRLETAVYAYGLYIWKALWPVHLAAIYPHPGRTLDWWKPLLGLVLIIAVSAIAWKQRSKRPFLAVGWCWFLGTAVPIIGIMQVGAQVIADRYAYVPFIGLFVMVAWTMLPGEENAQPAGPREESRKVRWAPGAVAALMIATLAFLTWRQVGYWQTNVDLWTHALNVTSDNSLAENYLATTLFDLGRYQEGMTHLRIYVSMEPMDPLAHARVAADYQDHGQYQEAANEFEAAIKAANTLNSLHLPGGSSEMLGVTYAYLALTYSQLGDSAKALDNAQKALDTDREAVARMIDQLRQSLTTRPTTVGYLRLGMFLQLFGQSAEAQQAFAQAQKLNPAVLPSLGRNQPQNSGNNAEK